MKRNTELLKRYKEVLSNISHIEASGIIFANRVISSKLEIIPYQVIASFNSAKEDQTNETLFIALK